jgi:hypothetical protein
MSHYSEGGKLRFLCTNHSPGTVFPAGGLSDLHPQRRRDGELADGEEALA